MKILYMPIIEPGDNHATALLNKRGLHDALIRAGHQVFQLDYLARNRANLYIEVELLIETYAPDMVLTQLHGADIFSPAQIVQLRMTRPEALWLNWSGDSWLHSLTAKPMIDMLRHFDLQMVAAPDVLPEYERLGIPAAFWQIAYEKPVGALPDMPSYDVVFLGNVINEKRRAMLEMLRTLPHKVGIYGDWEHADGRNTYDFGAGEALYRNARLAIADNVYADQSNYISNRPIQIMMAGGALCLHQHVSRMGELSNGWTAGVHYNVWHTLEDLRTLISYWTAPQEDDPKRDRDYIVKHAKEHCQRFHTYDARVQELMQLFMPGIRMQMTEYPTG